MLRLMNPAAHAPAVLARCLVVVATWRFRVQVEPTASDWNEVNLHATEAPAPAAGDL